MSGPSDNSSRRRRLSTAALALLAVGVGLTIFASLQIRSDIARQQSQQIEDRAHATTSLFSTVTQGVSALLTTGGVVAQSTHGNTSAFRMAVAPRMARVLLSNAVLFDVSDGRLRELTYAGTPPVLPAHFTLADRKRMLRAALTGQTLVAAHRRHAGAIVMGIATAPEPGSRYVVYGEIASPRAVSWGDQTGLDFAFYVGREAPANLLATNAQHLPIGGRRLVVRLEETGLLQQPVLVYGESGGMTLAFAAPWVVLALGILVSLALSVQYEAMRRRRDTALALVADLEAKNVELDLQAEINRHQALHDGLTELPNRTLFRDRIEQETRRHRRTRDPFAVVLIDLDHFKEVNDTLGHQSGDRLLQELARKLSESVREVDTVARLGGDEFGVLLCSVACEEDALAIAEKLREGLSGPVDVDGLTVEADASFGIALHPQHGEDVDALMRHADIALYRSKATHAPVIYASEHDHYSPARLRLVADLRHAIENDEIQVVYQPQAPTDIDRITSVEALSRWQHPELGLIMPDEFVPLAEHTGMIRALTRHVIDTALAQCRDWLDRGWEIGVAVNIGARDLVDAHFPEEVIGSLHRAGVDPSLLSLEITENTILTDSARARAVIMNLRGHGVRFAIDDFGAGHSSLSYLKRLPIQVLKIDKSFVLGMQESQEDAVIVQSTIALGHNLRFEVVAEGVETEELRQRLAELGCDMIQGYFLGRPLAPAQVEQLFEPPEAEAAEARTAS